MITTASIDEQLAQRASLAAQQMGMTLNQALGDYLEQLAGGSLRSQQWDQFVWLPQPNSKAGISTATLPTGDKQKQPAASWHGTFCSAPNPCTVACRRATNAYCPNALQVPQVLTATTSTNIPCPAICRQTPHKATSLHPQTSSPSRS